MPHLIRQAQSRSGQDLLDHGITDVLIYETPAGAFLYTTSGPTGGISVYRIDGDGGLSFIDFTHFRAGWADTVLPELSILETGRGPQLVVVGAEKGVLQTFDIGTDGHLNARQTMSGLTPAPEGLTAMARGNDDLMFAAASDASGFNGYRVENGWDFSLAMSVEGKGAGYEGSICALETVGIGGIDYVISACQEDCGVSVFRVAPNGLIATGRLGAADGLGIMTPTDLDVVQIGGRTFLLVTSSPNDGQGRSGAITVMEVHADGSLQARDHILDTRDTRFGQVQSLDIVEADGQHYVIAGGADDGVSVFALLPHGRLQLLDSLADDFDNGLANITDIDATRIGDRLHLFISSEIAPGVTAVSLDLSSQGNTVTHKAADGRRIGTAGDDLVLGGRGDDTIHGLGGDDLLEDGAGRDTLYGGAGADTFILRNDRNEDLIADFDAARDRLDLSDWPFLYDPWGLSVTSTGTGAVVTWRGEYLEVRSHDGTSLNRAEIVNAVIRAPNRPPNLAEIGIRAQDQLLEGKQSRDVLDGGPGNDTIYGYDGDDMLKGAAERDTLWGGNGGDLLDGGDNRDVLWGEAGDDILSGGSDFDTLYGGDGNDRIFGGWHADEIHGEAGNDRLFGGIGADRIFGGDGDDFIEGNHENDVLFGGPGRDTLWGGQDADRLFGDDGDDYLYGDAGFDRLEGGAGTDVLHGGDHADNLFGGLGDDRLLGGDGFDRLFGGAGNDRLFGGAGTDGLFGEQGDDALFGDGDNDRFFGGTGNDSLLGGDGRDTLYGGAGFDLINGGPGNDDLWGNFNADRFAFEDGHGQDTIWDFQADNIFEKMDFRALSTLNTLADVLGTGGAAGQQGAHVRIDTGGGDVIWVMNTDLDDLDTSDFLF